MAIVQGDERCGLAWIMENGMMTAWTRTLALGLLVGPLGCVVHVKDGDEDGFGGSYTEPGYGGDSGSAGTVGSSGAGGSSGFGGSGGSDSQLTAPTCDPEPIDDGDECVQCLKSKCCNEWLDCDDQSCTNEWVSVAECLVPQEFAGEDEYGMCISQASEANDGFVQTNTQALLDCAISPSDEAGTDTLCSSECFGSDIFLD
jgi:hypothetical protein